MFREGLNEAPDSTGILLTEKPDGASWRNGIAPRSGGLVSSACVVSNGRSSLESNSNGGNAETPAQTSTLLLKRPVPIVRNGLAFRVGFFDPDPKR